MITRRRLQQLMKNRDANAPLLTKYTFRLYHDPKNEYAVPTILPDKDGEFVHISEYYALLQAALKLEKGEPLPARYHQIDAEMSDYIKELSERESPLDILAKKGGQE